MTWFPQPSKIDPLRLYSMRQACRILGITEYLLKRAIKHKALTLVELSPDTQRIPGWSILELINRQLALMPEYDCPPQALIALNEWRQKQKGAQIKRESDPAKSEAIGDFYATL